MPSKSVTLDRLLESDLWREFEASAQKRRRRPVDVLAELMAEFVEAQNDVALFDSIGRDLRRASRTEDDSVEIVKAYRASRKR